MTFNLQAREQADFNALPAHVWPRNAARDHKGNITIAGVRLSDIAAEFGTPTMIVDEADFRARCQEMAAAFGEPRLVHYASKAFITSEIVRWVADEGLGLDVASLGELEIALHAGFPAADIAAHGNNKSDAYLRRIVSAGVGQVILDAPSEIPRLAAIAAEAGVVQEVMVRVTPGVEAHTHEFIATSHEDQKFGFSLATGAAFAAASDCIASEHLRLVGLHCHVGSQVFDAEGFSVAAQRVLGLYKQIHKELGVTLDYLDLGGGYGIAYLAEETALDVATVAQDLLQAVADCAQELGIEPPQVMVEPGRAIAGPSTVTLYTLGTLKDVQVTDQQQRRYLAVDGGMSDNIRPALYGSSYDVRVANRTVSGAPVATRVVGSHCESGDILVQDAWYPDDIAEGDLLAFAATGAYCYSMSSRYNMLLRPAIVQVKAGEARLMVRRETMDDYFRLEA